MHTFGSRVWLMSCCSVVWMIAAGSAQGQFGFSLGIGGVDIEYYDGDENVGVTIDPRYGNYGSPYYRDRSYDGFDGRGYVAANTSYRVAGPRDEAAARLLTVEGTSVVGRDFQRRAVVAFRDGRYRAAMREIDHAVVETPENGKLHLFASQVLFALGEYRAAAVALQEALTRLDEADWGFVVKHYRDFYRGTDYVTQMDRLVKFIKEKPDYAYGYFLRGYQHGYLGHHAAARRFLHKATQLQSSDPWAPRLLKAFGGTEERRLKTED